MGSSVSSTTGVGVRTATGASVVVGAAAATGTGVGSTGPGVGSTGAGVGSTGSRVGSTGAGVGFTGAGLGSSGPGSEFSVVLSAEEGAAVGDMDSRGTGCAARHISCKVHKQGRGGGEANSPSGETMPAGGTD